MSDDPPGYCISGYDNNRRWCFEISYDTDGYSTYHKAVEAALKHSRQQGAAWVRRAADQWASEARAGGASVMADAWLRAYADQLEEVMK